MTPRTSYRKPDASRLERFAYENRRDLTKAEAAMVKILIGMGWRFNIEHPKHWRNIIVDFLIPQYGLIVEVDGGYHRTQKEKDRNRDKALVRRGLLVQRFTNEQVLQFPRKTRATLLARIKAPVSDKTPIRVTPNTVSGRGTFIPSLPAVMNEAKF